ncbi:hypothetical protein BDQ17DRAFT_1337705 [Cyathus striatus]|nr:hypothetical protein BDQ17DRAFT_1337705 [Cyathus striatus]
MTMRRWQWWQKGGTGGTVVPVVGEMMLGDRNEGYGSWGWGEKLGEGGRWRKDDGEMMDVEERMCSLLHIDGSRTLRNLKLRWLLNMAVEPMFISYKEQADFFNAGDQVMVCWGRSGGHLRAARLMSVHHQGEDNDERRKKGLEITKVEEGHQEVAM